MRNLRTMLFTVFLFLIFTSSPLIAEEWLKDSITGCDIWGEKVDPKLEIASWSGSCVDGKAAGNGVLVWFKDGRLIGRYDGMMKGGFLDGHGLLYYHTKEGFDRYEGEFKNGEFNGEVTYIGAKGDRFEGTIMGTLENTTTGKGVYIDVDGDKYDGEYKNGQPDGQGYLIKNNGDEYKGNFKSGMYDGKGEIKYSNGDSYSGDFKGGEPSGKGIFKLSNGESFQGNFKNGVPHGQGTFTDEDGDTYKGTFIDSVPNGKIIRTANGKRTEQFWKDGELVK